MRENTAAKYMATFVIALALWGASGVIRSVSDERRERRLEAMKEISSSLTADQRIGVPFLRITVRETWNEDGTRRTDESRIQDIPAMKAELNARAEVTQRERGIFKAQAYELTVAGEADFSLPGLSEFAELNRAGAKETPIKVDIVIPVEVPKGLREFPVVAVAGISKGLTGEACPGGICYPVHISYGELIGTLKRVEFSLKVGGLDEVKFKSSAREFKVGLSSNWPSPAFGGNYLPTRREIGKDGFTANWDVLGATYGENGFSVKFMEPVDIYTQVDRSTKYAILFILCVFSGFLLVEALAKIRIHPLQYTLVGASLVVFYLLVLSLSEQISFGAAYLASAVASVSLIWFYLAAALNSRRQASLMGGAISFLYGVLFVILNVEDFALLMGALLVFTLLSAFMIGTRKVNWYELDLKKGA